MKPLFYRTSAYLMAALMGISFYFTIFYLIKMFPVIGLAVFSLVVLMAVFLFLEKDAVQLDEA